MSTTKKQLHRDHAKHALKNHKYTCLSRGETHELWRCAEPGSSTYAFDITMTRYGIAIMGDISGLVFRVGMDYGMGFLAGTDVEYYIHSKLEHKHFDEVEIDPRIVQLFLIQAYAIHFQENLPEHKFFESVDPDDPESVVWSDFIAEFGRLREYVDDRDRRYDSEIDELPINKTIRLIEDSECNESLAIIYNLISDVDQAFGGYYATEWTYTRPTSSLLFRLYLINEAAQQIIKTKQEEGKSD